MSLTTALVLAAQRDGRIDPLAAAMGVSHKCLVPLAGRPLILHVLEALLAAPRIGEIRVSIDDPAILDGIVDPRIRIVPSRPNLVDSVIEGVAGAAWPVLVTTADNALLTPAAIAQIQRDAAGADVAVAFTRRESVLAAHPDGQRRFYTFSEGGYSNCNAYWIASSDALGAAEVFRQGGQFAKHPGRIVKAFGLLNLVRFRFGIGSLDAAFARFSRRFGRILRPVVLEDGAVAIDVDNVRTHGIAEELLTARASKLAA